MAWRARVCCFGGCLVAFLLVALPSASASPPNPGLTDASVEALFRDYAESLTQRAMALEHGDGVLLDPGRAIELYCEAARLGHAEAIFSLGWMYANGRGTPREDSYAAALFDAAAARSHAHAERMTRFFKGEEAQFPPCIFVQPTLLVDSVRGLKERLEKLSPQRRHIAELIVDLAPHYGINPALGLAVAFTESALDPTAISPKNAMGVMQLIPETAVRFSVENAFDPEQNIRGGLAYLRWLLAYFRGNIELVAAAYNAGEGAVERYQGLPPFAETVLYVQRIGSLVEQTTHPYDSALVGPSPILVELEGAEPTR